MAAFLLANRKELRRALYRLLGTTQDDDALTENGEELNDVANYYVQHGLWLAQKFLIRVGFRDWLTTAEPEFAAAAADGTRSADLPDDFLRLAGDEQSGLGALMDSAGRPWGGLISPRLKRRAGANAYWIENGALHVGRGASPPAGLYYEYHYRHPVLESDVEEDYPLDFPEDWRPMIPAEGAYVAMMEGNFRFGPEQKAAIAGAQAYWRAQAAPWMRTTQEPQKLRAPLVRGTHGFL